MKIKAWHFAANSRRLGYGDGRLIVKGRTLKYTGKEPIMMCTRGLHASERLVDALRCAPGNIICRVELSGEIIRGNDKLCATERKCLWWIDGEAVLWELACWSAEQALSIWEKCYPDDRRPHDAIKARRGWLKGEVSDQELAAARDAAWDAVCAAAGAAASDAARVVTGAAARDAARVVTGAAQEKKFAALVAAAHRKQK